jgi:hypothetical protein
MTMGLWQSPPGQGVPDPEPCQHRWRFRYATFALPGPYLGDVCDLCGALHIDGPEAIKGPAANVAEGAAMYLDSLERRNPPPPAHGGPS